MGGLGDAACRKKGCQDIETFGASPVASADGPGGPRRDVIDRRRPHVRASLRINRIELMAIETQSFISALEATPADHKPCFVRTCPIWSLVNYTLLEIGSV